MRKSRKRMEVTRPVPTEGVGPRLEVALVASTAAQARTNAVAASSGRKGLRLRPLSLSRCASDLEAPLDIVLCPPGESVAGDLAFLREVRRNLLWPPPAAEIWSAIAGMRGSHDDPPPWASRSPRNAGRRAALLLEGDVTLDRARRAASSGAPRDWIVERVQRVRIARKDLDDLARLGIRWSVLEPVRVLAIAASSALVRARARWARLLPPEVAMWPLTSRPESRVPKPGSGASRRRNQRLRQRGRPSKGRPRLLQHSG